MRFGFCADASPSACWWLAEIDGLMTSAEMGSIETKSQGHLKRGEEES